MAMCKLQQHSAAAEHAVVMSSMTGALGGPHGLTVSFSRKQRAHSCWDNSTITRTYTAHGVASNSVLFAHDYGYKNNKLQSFLSLR